MQVGEISERTGVSVRAIRYYERAGLLPATRRQNGYRDFGPSAVERVRAIRDLLETGFTLADVTALAECLLSAEEGGALDSGCSGRTAAMYREKLAKIDVQIRTLRQLRQRVEERLAAIDEGRGMRDAG